MDYTHKNKLIITGLPRTGTTFMMAVLTELGLNTFYTTEKSRNAMANNYGAMEYLRDYRRRHNRGLRQGVDASPRIIKHPSSQIIDRILPRARKYGWEIDHVLISYRAFEPLIKSAIKRWQEKRQVITGEKIEREKDKVEVLFPFTLGSIVEDVLTHHYSYSFIEFPKLIEDVEYCYRAMDPIIDAGIHFKQFAEVHEKLADPKKVHFK